MAVFFSALHNTVFKITLLVYICPSRLQLTVGSRDLSFNQKLQIIHFIPGKLKYEFYNKSLQKEAPKTSITLFPLFFFQIRSWSGKKTEEKVFNWSEVHLSEATFYKIHTLVGSIKNILISADSMLKPNSFKKQCSLSSYFLTQGVMIQVLSRLDMRLACWVLNYHFEPVLLPLR